jgi:carboxyl-terminal processing protease
MQGVEFLSWGLILLLSSVEAFVVVPGCSKNGVWRCLTQARRTVQLTKMDVSPSKISSSIQLNEVLAAAALLFVTTMTAPVTVHMDQPLKHISIQLASASALTEQQVLVDDVWREVTRQFVDKSYNGLGEDGWRKKRLEAVKKVANVGPDDTEVVYSTIRTMLNALGDPYTRFLAPDQYESLTAYARGGTLSAAGIGVQLLLDPASGGVVVLSTVQNGPAAKAGVLPGDVILEVDGMDVQSATAEVVAAKCRGDVGSTVTLAIRHGSSSNNPSLLSSTTTFALTRAEIKVSPVESSTFVSDKGKKVGLIKLSSFNQETVSQATEALNDVKSHGASSIVIDIRGNAGGYMPAGVDVAKLFLPPQSRVISEVDRMDRATIYTADGIGS